ncbi:MAG: VOC family protein [Solirubrobacteraceae bacterium]
MSIYAALRYRDAAAAIDWLECAFGFQTTSRHEGPDGTIGHAELRLGESLIMLGQGAEDLQDPPAGPRAARVTIYVAVEDVDGLHDRAQAAGADVSDLSEQDYGSRDFSARDLEGNHWSFGTYVPDPQAAAASPDSA